MTRKLHTRTVQKSDGRDLTFYGWKEHERPVVADLPPLEASALPYKRWHPLRHEWVSYAGARQGRTFFPDAASCPLCPAKQDGLTEIPSDDFEMAVFENRFPAFRLDAGDAELVGGDEPAIGRCEVVVFSADHGGSLGGQSVERIELLFELWARQARQMMDEHGLKCVLPYESRGEEIGVTLHHPHGQIYGFGFVPDLLMKSAEAQKAAP
ncbi:MAG TPA: galactose-1-phosphate uridylyltransferase, partial [Rhodobiaceae bacterium]|nr:galactose-1-phosphate uridylyltransferase [Rhodobiaceae bacterium]